MPKSRGGIGFRDMKEFNTAMLAKQGWILLQEKTSLAYSLLKAKYFPNCNFMEATIGLNGRPSPTWRSIMSSQSLLKAGCRRILGSGQSIKIWEDHWLPCAPFKILSPRPVQCDLETVQDLIDPVFQNWKLNLLGELFTEDEIFNILSIPLSRNPRQDGWVWKFTPKGQYTVKSGYHASMSEQWPSKMKANETELWNLLWKIEAPEKFRILLWRICSNILPVTDRLIKKGVEIENLCSVFFETVETSMHCIFDCSNAREIWQSSPLNLDIAHWPQMDVKEVVLLALHRTPRDMHGLFAALCWGIWEERNNKVWNNLITAPRTVSFRSVRLFTEYEGARKALVKPNIQTNLSSRHWNPPEDGWTKLNTDGALIISQRKASVGVILRNSDGLMLGAIWQ